MKWYPEPGMEGKHTRHKDASHLRHEAAEGPMMRAGRAIDSRWGRAFPRQGVLNAIFLMIFCPTVHAQDSDAATEYLDRPQRAGEIVPAGPSPFGERVDLYSGAVSFEHADIVLPGTGPTISLIRTAVSLADDDASSRHDLGDWSLSIPRIETFTHSSPGGGGGINPGSRWFIGRADSPTRFERCTRFDKPLYLSGISNPESAWHGLSMITPDGDSRLLLKRSAQNQQQPNGFGVVPAATLDGWQVACLANTSNGEVGQGFLVIDPTGTRYWFDYLTGTFASTVKENDPFGGTIRQGRMLARMFATRIEDRFGNALIYSYGGDDRLDSITASDGRSVAVHWRADARLVDHITITPTGGQSRTWAYEFLNPTGASRSLSKVVLPDQTYWQFNNLKVRNPHSLVYQDLITPCHRRGSGFFFVPSYVSTMTTPAGLAGTFILRPRFQAKSYVSSACIMHAPNGDLLDSPYEEVPPLSANTVLVSKQVVGPGVSPLTWSYNHIGFDASTTEDACAASSSCPATKLTEEVLPDGSRRVHTFSNRDGMTEGQLIKTDVFAANQTHMSTEEFSYFLSNAGPFPSWYGETMFNSWRGSTHLSESITPLRERSLTLHGVGSFTTRIDALDTYARPISVTRSSSY